MHNRKHSGIFSSHLIGNAGKGRGCNLMIQAPVWTGQKEKGFYLLIQQKF